MSEESTVSIPPASPHRAGHYSGLHPEDQPYQSHMMAVQQHRPHSPMQGQDQAYTQTQTQQANMVHLTPPQQESERLILPAPLPAQASALAAIATSPLSPPAPTQKTEAAPALFRVPSPRTPLLPPLHPRKPLPQRRAVPILLILSCLFFLVATGVLAFIYIIGKPKTVSTTAVLTTNSNSLRINDTLTLIGKGFGAADRISFTRDGNMPLPDKNGLALSTQADSTGIFSVSLVISADWTLGQHVIYAIDVAQQLSVSTLVTIQQTPAIPPLLHLTSSDIDLGAAVPGTISKKTITLTNIGGGLLNWQAKSDQPWLTTSPATGTFSGSGIVLLVVDRSGLVPQPYSGHIAFSQQGSSTQPLTLTVTMGVTPAPTAIPTPTPTPVSASLNLSSSTLSFTSSATQLPTSQTLTLQNSGGRPLDWTITTTTKDGANWLVATPTQGHLEPNATQNMTISVNSVALAPNSYQGILTFTSAALGGPVTIPVALVVSAPAVASIGLHSNILTFTAVQGTNPQPQPFALTNSGTAVLHWVISEDQNATNFLVVSPLQGSLSPGQSIIITETPNFGQAGAGDIVATITISDSDPGTTVQHQQVVTHITITTQAAIIVSANNMTFNTSSSSASSTQFVLITNTGSAPLNWAGTSSAPWLTSDTPSGTLVPGGSISIILTCDGSQLVPHTYVATFIVRDTDTGTVVAPQTITVTLIVGP